MRRTVTLVATGLLAALLLVPAAAQASTAQQRAAAKADRNRDGLPDRWERRHGLSLRVKQGKLDQDRDGLNNKGEFKAGTDPRKADSDNDGLRDGAEQKVGTNPTDRDSDDDGTPDGQEDAGKVVSFENGVLTIALARGGTVSGQVTDATEIDCESAPTTPAPTATTSRNGSDDGPAHDVGDDHGGRHGDGRHGDDESGDDGESNCTTADLKPGATVHEAELELKDGAAVFEQIELIK
ncbi:MAG: hypothetical protein QOI91_385 [Solirubrobacteraceae bacterium]|jgi:hypothetical protein|nr:hypothetical protein [Solirubrobacteraceae bacterium]